MRHLTFILMLLISSIATAQSPPAAKEPVPPKSATAWPDTKAAQQPSDKPQAKAATQSAAAAQAEPTAAAAPPMAEKKPAAAENAARGEGSASTSPATPESQSTESAPTKWPGAADQPKAAAVKPQAPTAKPQAPARRRARAAIKRRVKPQPAPQPRPIRINPAAPAKYAGTYRVDSWQSLEGRGLYHFFYLQPGGAFLLGAEWPGRETSIAAGKWQASGDRLSLSGTIDVSTNKGRWRVPFRRSFYIGLGKQGIRLEPLPEKNRFGLLGWPNAYFFFRTRVSPNLPSRNIPVDAAKLDALIEKLRG